MTGKRMVLALLLALAVVACGDGRLGAVAKECSGENEFVIVHDEGGLVLRGYGDDDTTMSIIALTRLQCVLMELDTPESIVTRMENTNSLMGQQTASSDGLTYVWSYHPSAGFNLSINEEG